MIYEIVERLDFPEEVDPAKVFFFTAGAEGARGQRFQDVELNTVLKPALKTPERVAILAYGARPDSGRSRMFALPLTEVRDTSVAASDQEALLWDLNRYNAEGRPEQLAIVLGDRDDLRRLRQVLILKQVLELNKNLPLTLDAFRPGVQLLFPTREDMRNRYHLVDREVAQMFYETVFYYQASERVFNRMVHRVEERLGGK